MPATLERRAQFGLIPFQNLDPLAGELKFWSATGDERSCRARSPSGGPGGGNLIIIDAAVPHDALPSILTRFLENDGDYTVLTWSAPEASSASAQFALVVAKPTVGLLDLLEHVAASRPSDHLATTQRLAGLQRTLTQALAEPNPIRALVRRLAKTTRGVVAVVGATGTTDFATAPLPMKLLLTEIRRSTATTRTFGVGGWFGVAARFTADPPPNTRHGWLIVASRESGFPDPYEAAAAEIAASLVKTIVRVDRLAQQQDTALRSSLLEEALALKMQRNDATLAGRLSALGITFERETRVFVARMVTTKTARRAPDPDTLAVALHGALVDGEVDHLLSSRESRVIGLAEGSTATLRRLIGQVSSDRPFDLAIGRPVTSAGEIADSFHDGQLGIRHLRNHPAGGTSSVAYEEFDFATRLFADVGLEQMARWADLLLAPLQGQGILIDGLSRYFEHNQNIKLNVHQNSLRYRLGKIEELLGLSLRDPSAIASLFLALTAQSLVPTESERRVTRQAASASMREPDGDAGGVVRSEGFASRSRVPGGVIAPGD